MGEEEFPWEPLYRQGHGSQWEPMELALVQTQYR